MACGITTVGWGGGRFACGCGLWQKCRWLGLVAEMQLVGAGGRTVAVWDG